MGVGLRIQARDVVGFEIVPGITTFQHPLALDAGQ